MEEKNQNNIEHEVEYFGNKTTAVLRVVTGTRIYNLEKMDDGTFDWQETRKDGKHLGYIHGEYETPQEALEELAPEVTA